ncbi:MAG: zinc ribbon domain-containing protein [Clostridia bacterium]|nr:zinc ribbon domain-containing protein [Clostridia bacterium]
MFCPYCGSGMEDGSVFCPVCGRSLTAEVAENPYVAEFDPASVVRSRIMEAIGGPLMLAICILVSAAALFSFELFSILFTIFLWIAFAKARSGSLSASHLRNVSGTVFAQCILQYVGAGLMVLFGFLFYGVWGFAQNAFDMISKAELLAELEAELGAEYAELYGDLVLSILEIHPIVFLLVFLLIGAVMLILTLFGYRYIHQFAKSLYCRFYDGTTPLCRVGAAKGWLMVLGILNCISALTSILAVTSFLASAALGVAMILASVLISKTEDA